MHLFERLDAQRKAEASPFRAQLLKEDIERLARVRDLAAANAGIAPYLKAALYIGWSQGDFRTHELKPTLEPFLVAYHAYWHGGCADAQDSTCSELWEKFATDRLDRLVGCLSRVR
ncbi:MAG: hypothetical protein HY057_11915 [Rhodospirillales bacterium]|nr:hypothetical protein [Rhodospirillales bacterium]